MQKVNIKEARQQIGRLIEAVTTGEEIIITKHGKPVARLQEIVGEEKKELRFPDRRKFRAGLPPAQQSSVRIIREMRNERG